MKDTNKKKANMQFEIEPVTVDEVTPTNESLLVEYAATNDAYMHYDNFSWQVGAVLIAGTFVFWGFLIDENAEPTRFLAGSVLVAFLMSFWMKYSSHNRQIYLCKLHRLHEIEKVLGMKQHSRWRDKQQKEKQLKKDGEIYCTLGLPGHKMDAILYAISSLGAPLIGFFNNIDFHFLKIWKQLLVFSIILLLVFLVLKSVIKNEEQLKNYLKNKDNFK